MIYDAVRKYPGGVLYNEVGVIAISRRHKSRHKTAEPTLRLQGATKCIVFWHILLETI